MQNLPSRDPLPYEIYAALLAPKRPGWALWMPEPNNNLPIPYRKKGVQFGDVGIIAPDGSFSFIFNICVSRDNPINPRSLPEEFVPIHPPIDPIDIRRFTVFKAGSCLASTSIEKVENDVVSPELSFQCSGSEGVILTMPEGAISEDLEGLRKFREYAAVNVKMWYKYIIGTRGREAKNGDVRLVVGCDKSASWGVAALPNTSQHSKLKFKSLDAQTSDSRSPSYTWEHSGTADVRDGPAQEEIDALSREDTSDDLIQGKYLNQCLFVRTLNLELNAEDWENLIHEIGIGNTLSEPGTGTASHSPSNRGPSFGNTQAASSTSSNFGAQRTVSDAPVMELNSRGTTANRLTISCLLLPQ
ncbi:hypothetical protein M413DRAFT_61201 [Hebeloma cylindrosporum]|uniref:Uncharacterized protein n=1 Tax=Hebeloma cylindrosporum TaxID=76867 RepID=A0A0C3CWK4_HEBCY|nr:hypothetical protein M413DRAFT_61201 [Hebeloma cylindrosporum h7]